MTSLTKEQIGTYSGLAIDPLFPDPDSIDINDIAHSLANQCRFTGHTRIFYSVAQHSILVSEIVDYNNALWGLLHDASEAYLSDIARPIKRGLSGFAEAYAEVEEGLMISIATKYGLSWPMPDDVKWADNVLLRTEIRDLMPPSIEFTPGLGGEQEEMLDDLGPIFSPPLAEVYFLERFKDLT